MPENVLGKKTQRARKNILCDPSMELFIQHSDGEYIIMLVVINSVLHKCYSEHNAQCNFLFVCEDPLFCYRLKLLNMVIGSNYTGFLAAMFE